MKHLIALVTAVLLAISGVAAAGAQAASFELALPLSPASQENALRTAKQFLDMGTGFSHAGLIYQLEREGYSAEDARYAADNVNADWNQQAAMSAKHYLVPGLSHVGLVDWLERLGYTPAQAEYGTTAAGL
jgi:Host cell surface-exposed lipoprotein